MFHFDTHSPIAIHRLPDDFLNGNPNECCIHFYEASETTFKNQVQLSQHLFCLLLQGQKTVHDATSGHQINAQEFMLMPRGSVLMTEKTTESGTFKSILLFFSDAFLIDFSSRHGFSKKSTQPTGRNTLVWKKDAFVTNYIQSLELLKSNPMRETLQQLKLEELLCYLFQTHPEAMEHFLINALQEHHYRSIKQVVNANLDNHLTVEELAFLCNQSVSTFKRHFAEAFHTSPKKYFTAHRMRKAQQLLLLHHRPSDIYTELGYETLSSFSAEFKKYTGHSPKQFQAELDPKPTVFEPIA